MKSVMIQLFGAYVPNTYDTYVAIEENGAVTYELVSVIGSGLAGVDWAWVSGAAIFAIAFWSFFRIVGVLIGGK